jgi:hypothetical protein
MVCQRSRRYGNRTPHPAWQLDEYMIAPAGALPVDHRKALTKKRMRAVSDDDLIAGSVERRGTLRGLVL